MGLAIAPALQPDLQSGVGGVHRISQAHTNLSSPCVREAGNSHKFPRCFPTSIPYAVATEAAHLGYNTPSPAIAILAGNRLMGTRH